MSTFDNMDGAVKASLAVGAFAAVGVAALFVRAPLGPYLLPNLIFYVVLLVNTWYSIRFWSPLQPKDVRQTFIDGVLAFAYMALALSMGRPLSFAVAALVLFVLATLKYALMLGKIPQQGAVRKKLRLDAFGALVCAIALAVTATGYPLFAAWSFAIGFTLANIYLLKLNPMYRL